MIVGALITFPDVVLAALIATLIWLIIFRPWPHEEVAGEVGVDRDGALERGSVSVGTGASEDAA